MIKISVNSIGLCSSDIGLGCEQVGKSLHCSNTMSRLPPVRHQTAINSRMCEINMKCSVPGASHIQMHTSWTHDPVITTCTHL